MTNAAASLGNRAKDKNVGPCAASYDIGSKAAPKFIIAATPEQLVCATTASEEIVSKIAAQNIGAVASGQRVITAACGDCEVFAALEVNAADHQIGDVPDIAGCKIAAGYAASDISGHRRIVDDQPVLSGTCINAVGAAKQGDAVHAAAGHDGIGPLAGKDNVLPAAGRDGVGAIADPDKVSTIKRSDGVGISAANDGIGALPSRDRRRAAPGVDVIISGTRGDSIGPRSGQDGEMFDGASSDRHHASATAGFGKVGGAIAADRPSGLAVIHNQSVDTQTTIDRVSASGHGDLVVARVTNDAVAIACVMQLERSGAGQGHRADPERKVQNDAL